jgi:tetratricopeptide (TPR) repeat protein
MNPRRFWIVIISFCFCLVVKNSEACFYNKRFKKRIINRICKTYEERDFFKLERLIQQFQFDNNTRYPDCFYRALGSYYYYNNDYQKALEFFSRVKNINFRDIINLSAIYIKLKKWKKAEDLLLKAKLKYTSEPELFYNLAIVYVQEKKYFKARSCLFKVLNSYKFDENLRRKALILLNYIGY